MLLQQHQPWWRLKRVAEAAEKTFLGGTSSSHIQQSCFYQLRCTSVVYWMEQKPPQSKRTNFDASQEEVYLNYSHSHKLVSANLQNVNPKKNQHSASNNNISHSYVNCQRKAARRHSLSLWLRLALRPCGITWGHGYARSFCWFVCA